MDAKVGDWVVTPRIGKPVEVNALWINALRTCAALAPSAGDDPAPFAAAALRAEASFERFWSAEHGWCYDVIDGPDGADASLRPNQIFAVSLPIGVLDVRAGVRSSTCARRGCGRPPDCAASILRDPRYAGRYGGDQRARDGAYHQGTVWTWLAGPFALAHARVYGDAAASLALLDAVRERAHRRCDRHAGRDRRRRRAVRRARRVRASLERRRACSTRGPRSRANARSSG